MNVSDLNLSSLQRESINRSHMCFTPLFSTLFPLRSSSLRCDGFEHRAEVRMRHCFSVILHPHRLKIERKRSMTHIYDDHLRFWRICIFCLTVICHLKVTLEILSISIYIIKRYFYSRCICFTSILRPVLLCQCHLSLNGANRFSSAVLNYIY